MLFVLISLPIAIGRSIMSNENDQEMVMSLQESFLPLTSWVHLLTYGSPYSHCKVEVKKKFFVFLVYRVFFYYNRVLNLV